MLPPFCEIRFPKVAPLFCLKTGFKFFLLGFSPSPHLTQGSLEATTLKLRLGVRPQNPKDYLSLDIDHPKSVT